MEYCRIVFLIFCLAQRLSTRGTHAMSSTRWP